MRFSLFLVLDALPSIVHEVFEATRAEQIPAHQHGEITVDAKTALLVWMVINDGAATELMNAVIHDWLGPEGVVAAQASPGGDDFAAYTQPRTVDGVEVAVPGVYVSLGIRPPGAEYIDLHDPRLPRILDPASILVGVRLFTLTAVAALRQHPHTNR